MSLGEKDSLPVIMFACGHLNKYREDLSSCIGCLEVVSQGFSRSLVFSRVSSFFIRCSKNREKMFLKEDREKNEKFL